MLMNKTWLKFKLKKLVILHLQVIIKLGGYLLGFQSSLGLFVILCLKPYKICLSSDLLSG